MLEQSRFFGMDIGRVDWVTHMSKPIKLLVAEKLVDGKNVPHSDGLVKGDVPVNASFSSQKFPPNSFTPCLCHKNSSTRLEEENLATLIKGAQEDVQEESRANLISVSEMDFSRI